MSKSVAPALFVSLYKSPDFCQGFLFFKEGKYIEACLSLQF